MSNKALELEVSRPLLQVEGLRTHFYTEDGVVRAVDGVSLSVREGEVFGLVGESGCGKTVTGLSILRLVEAPGKIVSGEIEFDGTSLLGLTEREMERLRGRLISMIFQQPVSSLNPVFPVGYQVAEVLKTHQRLSREAALEAAVDLLSLVGIPDACRKAQSYPHELSGGQAQRVMIAIALALNPKLLIADEPTTALDVTIQAQILDLLRHLQERHRTAFIFITHDLGVIAELAERVAVMYAGQIVEESYTLELFDSPCHPYTQGLIASVPVLGRSEEWLNTIPGSVPNLIDLPPGCRFAPRCKARVHRGLSICTEREPDMIDVGPRHAVRCWLYEA